MHRLDRRRFKRWALPTMVLLGSGVLGAVRDTRSDSEIAWVRDFAAGLHQARQTHQPLLLSFHTPGRGWCAKLDVETFAAPDVVRLSHRFVCVRLDSEIDGDICDRFRVLDFPTTLLADSEGRVFARITGYVPPDRLAPILRAALGAGGGIAGVLAAATTPGFLDKAQGQR